MSQLNSVEVYLFISSPRRAFLVVGPLSSQGILRNMGFLHSSTLPSLKLAFYGINVCLHQARGNENSMKGCTWEVFMGETRKEDMSLSLIHALA